MKKHFALFSVLLLLIVSTADAQEQVPEGYEAVVHAFSQDDPSATKRLIAKLLVEQGEIDAYGLILATQRALESFERAANKHGIVAIHNTPRTAYLDFEATLDQLKHVVDDSVLSWISVDDPAPTNLDSALPFVTGDQLHSRTPPVAGRQATVAVLDSGVDNSHSFIASRVIQQQACFSWRGHQSTSLCPNGMNRQNGALAAAHCDAALGNCDHGTHVAGIAVSGNSSLTGAAPEAKVLPIQVFSRVHDSTECAKHNRSAPCTLFYTKDLFDALHWLLTKVERGGGQLTAPIYAANLSLGGGKHVRCDGHLVADVVQQLRLRGVAVVASSGNKGYKNYVGAPACISAALTVGAVCDDSSTHPCTSTGATIKMYSHSNSGEAVDLLAPGVDVESSVTTSVHNRWRTASFTGTSMAAPIVSGGIAALQAYIGGTDVDSVESLLKTTGVATPTLNPARERPVVRFNQALEHYRTTAPPNQEYISMRDTWTDTGVEPDDPATAGMVMHNSPDIWIRNSPYGLTRWCEENHHQHENPIAGQDNYGCVRIGNKGRLRESGTIQIYGAGANLNLSDPKSWTLIAEKNVVIEPLLSKVVPFLWNDKDIPSKVPHYCLLARWRPAGDDSSLSLAGGLSNAVRSSNNLIWRNLVVVDGRNQPTDNRGRSIVMSSFDMESGEDGTINLVVDIASLVAGELDSIGELILELGGDPQDLSSEPTSQYMRHDGGYVEIPLAPGVYYIPNVVLRADPGNTTIVTFALNREEGAPIAEHGSAVLSVNIMVITDVEGHKRGEPIVGPGIQYDILGE